MRYCIRHVHFATVKIYECIFFHTREGSALYVCNFGVNGFIQLKMAKLLSAIGLCSSFNVGKPAEINLTELPELDNED